MDNNKKVLAMNRKVKKEIAYFEGKILALMTRLKKNGIYAVPITPDHKQFDATKSEPQFIYTVNAGKHFSKSED